jgi:hypothetical protein
MYDVVLVRFDGSTVTCEQNVEVKDIIKILERWDANKEQAAILVWPVKTPLPIAILPKA